MSPAPCTRGARRAARAGEALASTPSPDGRARRGGGGGDDRALGRAALLARDTNTGSCGGGGGEGTSTGGRRLFRPPALRHRTTTPPGGAHEGPVHTACTPASRVTQHQHANAPRSVMRRPREASAAASASRPAARAQEKLAGRSPAAARPRTSALPSNVTSAACPVTPAAAVWGKAAAPARGGWVGGWVSMEEKGGDQGTPPPLRAPLVCVRLLVPLGVNGMATSRKCGRRGQALCPLASWRTRRRGGAPVAAGGVAARGSVGLSDGTEWKAQAVPPGSRAGARLFQRLVRSSPPTHASDTGWAPVDWSNGEGGR